MQWGETWKTWSNGQAIELSLLYYLLNSKCKFTNICWALFDTIFQVHGVAVKFVQPLDQIGVQNQFI